MPRPSSTQQIRDGQPRQQRTGADFLARQAAGDRPEQMRGAELAVLARVEQGEFLAIGDPADNVWASMRFMTESSGQARR